MDNDDMASVGVCLYKIEPPQKTAWTIDEIAEMVAERALQKVLARFQTPPIDNPPEQTP